MQKSEKVVVVSQHYQPDPSTTAAIIAAISERVAREADFPVLSGTAGSATAAAAGKPAVVEIGNWMPGKARLLKRALAELLFTMLPYAFAARIKGARSVPVKAMRALNALMFRSLDIVVTIGRDTERLLLRYGGKTSDKIHFIPNWAGARRSRDCSRQSLSRRFPLHSRPDHQAISA